MTVIEKANELGQLIKDCPEMKALTEAEQAQAKDEAAQELIKEFNLKRMNLARDMQEGKMTQEEAIKANNEAFEEMVAKSESIKAYVEAKKKFDNLLNGVTYTSQVSRLAVAHMTAILAAVVTKKKRYVDF